MRGVLFNTCKRKAHAHQQNAHARKRTHNTRTHIITITRDYTRNTKCRERKVMNDSEFINFINTTASKGGCTFNLATSNVSKQAREVLAKTQYKALAKQHINASVVSAYNNNAQFKAKLNKVMEELHITVVAQ